MPMIRRSTTFLILMTILMTGGVSGWLQAAEWSAPLQSGGQVTVDPRTNRPTVLRNGVETQLWDGVHRLQDGSTITVRSGTVVPNQAILNARSMPDHPRQADIESWLGTPINGASPCEQLVERVCGAEGACSDYAACAPVRQLLKIEERERAASGQPGSMSYASGQCKEADRDRAFFASCAGPDDSTGRSASQSLPAVQPSLQSSPSACNMLVDKVCGSDGACSAREACNLARQLMTMAKQQRARSSFTSVPQDNAAESQCREALLDEELFARCR